LVYETFREHEESLRQVLGAQDLFSSSAKKVVVLTWESRKAFDDIQGILLRAFDTSLQDCRVTGRMVIDRGVGVIGTGSSGKAIGQFNVPTGTALSPPSKTYPGGLLFVADKWNHRVQVFNATTSDYVRTIGTGVKGNSSNQFCNPNGIALLTSTEAFPEGLLYVSDSSNNRVQVFNLATWVFHKSITCNFKTPCGLSVLPPSRDHPQGLLFVADIENKCVKVLNAMSGEHCYTVGTEGVSGSEIGWFNDPSGLSLQLASEASLVPLLYVADTGNSRVQIFNALTGQYVRMLGTGEGSGAGQFNQPLGVSVQPANTKYPGGVVYVADTGNRRVQVFHAITGQHLGILAGSEGKSALGISVCSDSKGRNLVFVTNNTNHNIDIYLDA
jgi:hypothetical protein